MIFFVEFVIYFFLPDSVNSNGSASVTEVFLPVFNLSFTIGGSSDVTEALVSFLADRW